jgi:4-phytase/acid phosphatase
MATGDDVRLEVVLMRHGVRSPTKPAATYADYANAAWPDWPVAPGMLTSHGHEGMQGIGARLRKQLLADGALGEGCPGTPSLVVIGDSTPRNRESSAAVLDGLAPGCGLGFLATEGASNNALFHFRKGDDNDDTAAKAQPPAALAELQGLLLGCGKESCTDVASRDGKRLLPADADKAMKLAGTLSENLMLAYAEGMPMTSVAFGRGDVALLGRLITLHNAAFASSKKAMPAAANAGSNFVAHMLATFDTARGVTTTVQPLTTSKRGVVVLIGHDTNLATTAGVLGLDWHDPRRPDDYPPGGALVFSLVTHKGHDIIRVRRLMPSMDELRANRFDAMRAEPVRVAGCHTVGECTPAEFAALAKHGIDAARVDEHLPAMTPQHAP